MSLELYATLNDNGKTEKLYINKKCNNLKNQTRKVWEKLGWYEGEGIPFENLPDFYVCKFHKKRIGFKNENKISCDECLFGK